MALLGLENSILGSLQFFLFLGWVGPTRLPMPRRLEKRWCLVMWVIKAAIVISLALNVPTALLSHRSQPADKARRDAAQKKRKKGGCHARPICVVSKKLILARSTESSSWAWMLVDALMLTYTHGIHITIHISTCLYTCLHTCLCIRLYKAAEHGCRSTRRC